MTDNTVEIPRELATQMRMRSAVMNVAVLAFIGTVARYTDAGYIIPAALFPIANLVLLLRLRKDSLIYQISGGGICVRYQSYPCGAMGLFGSQPLWIDLRKDAITAVEVEPGPTGDPDATKILRIRTKVHPGGYRMRVDDRNVTAAWNLLAQQAGAEKAAGE